MASTSPLPFFFSFFKKLFVSETLLLSPLPASSCFQLFKLSCPIKTNQTNCFRVSLKKNLGKSKELSQMYIFWVCLHRWKEMRLGNTIRVVVVQNCLSLVPDRRLHSFLTIYQGCHIFFRPCSCTFMSSRYASDDFHGMIPPTPISFIPHLFLQWGSKAFYIILPSFYSHNSLVKSDWEKYWYPQITW